MGNISSKHRPLQVKDMLKPEVMTDIIDVARQRLEREGAT